MTNEYLFSEEESEYWRRQFLRTVEVRLSIQQGSIELMDDANKSKVIDDYVDILRKDYFKCPLHRQ